MLRLLLMIALVFVLAYAGAILADHPGTVTIDLGERIVQTTLAALVGSAALLCLAAAALTWLVGWLRHDAPFIGQKATIRRQGRGFRLLNRALVAMAAGDHQLSRRLVGEAEVLLPPQPMLHLLAAETALRAGDTGSAEQRFQALEQMEEGRFLGLRGLVLTAQRMGREAEALSLARTAYKEKPKSPWVLQTLFTLEVTAGHWEEAATLLDRMERTGLKNRDLVRRHRGALFFAEAVEAGLEGNKSAARALYRKALKVRPGFASAVAALARLEQAAGNRRAADTLIRKAWADAPFPSLRAAYKALDVTESRQDWLTRAGTLAATNPDHRASKLLVADAALKAEDTDLAADMLDQLTAWPADRDIVQARLTLARMRGDPVKPIEQALSTARAAPGWVCNACQHQADAWTALCSQCAGFDTLEWQDGGNTGHGPSVSPGQEDTVMLLGPEPGPGRPPIQR